MKFALLVGILCLGILLVRGETYSEEKGKKLVQTAIIEETEKYEGRVKLAAIGGAQSKRSAREMVKSTEYSREANKISNIYRNALQKLTSSHKMDRPTALKYLQEALPQQCLLPEEVTCDPQSKYRTVNGACNNLQNPSWGQTNKPNARLVDPAYDGINDEPRGGRQGGTLPSARNLSVSVHQTKGEEAYETDATHMVAQFGQFLDHDISLTPVEALSCCGNTNQLDDCWTISVDPTDEHYSQFGITCLDFVRTSADCSPTGIDRREQINAITAYIDGSMVYGSNATLMNNLRSKQNGRLAVNSEHPNFLPWRSDVGEGDAKEIIAGDVRANEMPGLTTMHTLFLREHNRIADQLSGLTNWDDEKIFQETRRIIAAELQQITYDEFLPAILGPAAMEEYKLYLPNNGGYTVYNNSADATIISSFATAAYRFGHTLVNGLIKLMMEGVDFGSYRVRDNYGSPVEVVKNHTDGKTGYDLILGSLITQLAQKFDGEIHSDMTNDLFMNTVTNIGTDLAARNIQRGRDHGTPSYNAFRRFCRFGSLTTWENRPEDFSPENWDKLKAMYVTPDDIDLYTGGLLQTPVEYGLSGKTFVCLQAIQFERLKDGDRFFFTHENQAGSFSPVQLAALRKRTLGDIICENSNVARTQMNVFMKSSPLNPLIPCDASTRKLDIVLFAVDPAKTDESSAGLATLSVFSLVFSFVINFL